MKGSVFTLLEAFVCESAGSSAWEAILEDTTLVTQEPFVGPGTYPDADLVALVVSTSRHLGLEVPVALRGFGRFAFPHLMRMLPPRPEETAYGFFDGLERVIHTEVRKLDRAATPPKVPCAERDGGVLVLTYDSPRRLCTLAEGLIDGAADHFHTRIEHHQESCMARGDPRCTFVLRLGPAPR